MRGSKVAILEHMRKHKWITSKDAFELYGITRLAACIFDLRNAGYEIETVMVDATTRFGESCKYARYVLHEKGGDNSESN